MNENNDLKNLVEELIQPTQNEAIEDESDEFEEELEQDENEDEIEDDDEESFFESEKERSERIAKEQEEAKKQRFMQSAEMIAKTSMPLFNMVVELFYNKLIIPGDDTIETLKDDLARYNARNSKAKASSIDEKEYFNTVNQLWASVQSAKISEYEITSLTEALVPVVEYYSNSKPSPFGPLMLFAAFKIIPATMSFKDKGNLRKQYTEVVDVTNDSKYSENKFPNVDKNKAQNVNFEVVN